MRIGTRSLFSINSRRLKLKIMQRTINIQPIKIDSKHFVTISMDGRELRRHGPYADANAAEATVDRLVRHWLTTSPIHVTTNDALINNHDFVSDLARFADGILSEADVRKKHYLSDEDWERLGNDDALVRAIEAEKVRRVRSGATARERAQALYIETPSILGDILRDNGAPARHRIESAKELRQIAATGPEATPAADRFVIKIDLGGDVIHLNKSIKPDPNDGNIIDAAPQELLPMIAANKREGNGGNGGVI
jgi:hypothetical protein